MKLPKGLKAFMESMEEEDLVETKSLPMRPNWKKMRDEVEKLSDQYQAIERELESKRNLMWSTIDVESGEYGSKRFSPDHKEIIILEPKDKNKPVKSPIQML